jgi:glycosyltransferase involved in cell wall biosynthesis
MSYYFGVKFATTVILQNEEQRILLKRNFKRDGIVIKSLVEFPDISHQAVDCRHFILWVSNIQTWKQPEIFINIAKALPSLKFVMIGGPLLISITIIL